MLFYGVPSQYALRALSHIVRHADGPCQAAAIADDEDIPKHFLLKLLHELVRAKILTSKKGPGGGFSMAGDPKDVSLLQVVSIFEDVDANLTNCAIGWAKCSDSKPCKLHESYKKIREQVAKYLVTVNLEAFVEAEVRKNNGRNRR